MFSEWREKKYISCWEVTQISCMVYCACLRLISLFNRIKYKREMRNNNSSSNTHTQNIWSAQLPHDHEIFFPFLISCGDCSSKSMCYSFLSFSFLLQLFFCCLLFIWLSRTHTLTHIPKKNYCVVNAASKCLFFFSFFLWNIV